MCMFGVLCRKCKGESEREKERKKGMKSLMMKIRFSSMFRLEQSDCDIHTHTLYCTVHYTESTNEIIFSHLSA